jgi:hypothetical protein
MHMVQSLTTKLPFFKQDDDNLLMNAGCGDFVVYNPRAFSYKSSMSTVIHENEEMDWRLCNLYLRILTLDQAISSRVMPKPQMSTPRFAVIPMDEILLDPIAITNLTPVLQALKNHRRTVTFSY